MAELDTQRVQHRMAEAGFADAKALAEAADIPYGGLRNAVGNARNPDPLSLVRVYAIARVLARVGEDVRTVVADILANNEGVPDEPPHQPTQPKAPTRRQDKEGTKTGPRRTQAVAS